MGFIDFNYYTQYVTSQDSSIIGKTLPTVIGIFIGFGLNRLYDYFKERKDISKAGEEFINEVELYKETIEKQIETLTETINGLKKPESIPLTIVNYIRTDEDRFKSINRLYVYKYFEQKFKDNLKKSRGHVNKLYGVIKVSETESIRMKQFFEDYISKGTVEHGTFVKAMNKMRRGYAEIVVEVEKNGGDPNADSFIKELHPLFLLLEKNQDKNLIQIIELICTPMKDITARYRTDPRKNLISNELQVCFDTFNLYNELKNDFVFQLTQILNSYTKLIVDIEETLKEYKA